MCVSADLAEFTGTLLYGGRLDHPQHGQIEVLGYQNTAVNLAAGPNAMLLHLPAPQLTRDNFIPVGRHSDVLTRMRDTLFSIPVVAGGRDIAWMGAEPPVQVFDHDIYTIVLAGDPTLIPAALHRVPAARRPALRPALFEFYADVFPGHTIVLCCFANAEALQAKPLLMWYPPADPDRIVLPALDCHTGAVPDLDAAVLVNHVVLLGADRMAPELSEPMDWPRDMRHALRAFLPDRVTGARLVDRPLPNGDFAIGYDDLLNGDVDRLARLRPGD